VFNEYLEELRERGLLRGVEDRDGPQGRTVSVGGRELINFSSNDYLGLSVHPEVIGAAVEAARIYGAGAGASRLLAGGTTLHRELEDRTALFIGRPSAVLFSSGYHANTGAIPALAREGDEILSDELNHASIIDGCRLSRAKASIYAHGDANHLESLLGASRARVKLIVTESVFSMEGDLAPLNDIYELAEKHGALLYVDEAHAVGVFGGGRGLMAETVSDAQNPRLITMGTYGKALGSCGAFIAADEEVMAWLRNTARTFIFSTALPPAVAGASLAALEIVRSGRAPIPRLWENRDMLFDALKGAGLDTGRSGSPIIPVMLGSVEEALHISGRLREHGIYAPAIRPPSVKQPRLRLTVAASHSPEDIKTLFFLFAKRKNQRERF
jgi:8-amino-7-oxononanoate synthase